MKFHEQNSRYSAFTLIEPLAVIAKIAKIGRMVAAGAGQHRTTRICAIPFAFDDRVFGRLRHPKHH